MKKLVLTLVLICVPSLALATTFQTLDYPGTMRTGIQDINDSGVMVGTYRTGIGWNGFLYDGAFTSLEYPGAHITHIADINNQGAVLGYGYDGSFHPFIYDGTYNAIDIPAPAADFNDSGVVVGGYRDDGYIFDDGSFDLFSVPDSISTAATGINDLGQVTGYYRTDEGYFGFIKTDDIYETLLPPWATSAHAYDINDLGHVVGSWYDQSESGAFLYDGEWHNLGSDMQAFGINNLGTIVGKLDEGSLEHGFVISQAAAPIPEPATMLLLGTGLIGLAALKRKH